MFPADDCSEMKSGQCTDHNIHWVFIFHRGSFLTLDCNIHTSTYQMSCCVFFSVYNNVQQIRVAAGGSSESVVSFHKESKCDYICIMCRNAQQNRCTFPQSNVKDKGHRQASDWQLLFCFSSTHRVTHAVPEIHLRCVTSRLKPCVGLICWI